MYVCNTFVLILKGRRLVSLKRAKIQSLSQIVPVGVDDEKRDVPRFMCSRDSKSLR